jgi:hypothetical protein
MKQRKTTKRQSQQQLMPFDSVSVFDFYAHYRIVCVHFSRTDHHWCISAFRVEILRELPSTSISRFLVVTGCNLKFSTIACDINLGGSCDLD